ncbi:MAG: hypothetical protein NTX61_01375 [Bacteroidetes bacterium]|nr:hypothetical protein [Bacteroidota bacterium]
MKKEIEGLFYSRVSGLYTDYVKVKEAIISAENLNPEKRVYIAPLNQLRSALDHILKASVAETKESIEYELVEAKSHINRAGYDAFEITATNLFPLIRSTLYLYTFFFLDLFPANIPNPNNNDTEPTRLTLRGNSIYHYRADG